MTIPATEQTKHNALADGKAHVLAITGLLALNQAGVNHGVLERLQRRLLLKLYRRRLRQLVVNLPSDWTAEILAASKEVKLPIGEFSLN